MGVAAAICVLGLIAIVAILSGGSLGQAGGQAIASALCVVVFGLCALAGAALRGRRPSGQVPADLTIGIAALGLVLSLAAVWAAWDGNSNGLIEAAGAALALSLATAHSCLLSSRGRESDSQGTRALLAGTIGATLLLGLVIAGAIAGDQDFDPQFLGVLAVLVVIGTLLLPISRRLNRAE